jgi:phosphoribosylaminoimidazole-succinocarboxamide synthase
MLCGVKMPDGMSQNDPFPYPIITPTSKADEGHDEDISEEEILIRGIVTNEVWDKLKAYTLALYHRGQQMTIKQGLILVDTKYEFGIHKGEIVLMDEIHTPDSSRYFYKDGYEERQQAGKPQRQLSKEFVREWLMENGFQGKDGQTMPIMPEEFVQEVSNRYIHLYELITGQDFIKDSTMNIMERVEKNVLTYLQNKNLK